MPTFNQYFSPEIAMLMTLALIFCARVCDVSIGTLRIISLANSRRWLATALGFAESLTWLIAIRQILDNLTNPFAYLAYAGGFAAGTYVGMRLDERLGLGYLAVQIITREDASDLLKELNAKDFGVTSVAARGVHGRVRLIHSIIRRRELDHVLEILRASHPKAFLSISNIRTVTEGIFPVSRTRLEVGQGFRFLRKSK